MFQVACIANTNFMHIFLYLKLRVSYVFSISFFFYFIYFFFIPPRNRGGVIFSLQFVCVCVCVCVCLCVRNSCEQNSSRTDAPIWMWFSLNGCLPHWLGPYWNWWPWVKGQGHSNLKHVKICEQNADRTGQPSLTQSSLSSSF